MTAFDTKTSFDFNFGGFKSVVPPTSQTILSYMPHLTIDAVGRVNDDGLVRHESFAFELHLIVSSYAMELAGASKHQRKRISKARDAQVAVFWQRGLHRLDEMNVTS